MSTGGLMVISQFAVFTKDFGIDKVSVLGFAALPLALTIDRITNGLTRPIFGWVSDRIGRENTMAIAFIGEGAAILAMLYARDNPLLYVLLTGVVFFGLGEIFSLFPSTLTDTFGTRNATTNMASSIWPKASARCWAAVAAWIYQQQGSWMAGVRADHRHGCRHRPAGAVRAESRCARTGSAPIGSPPRRHRKPSVRQTIAYT